MYLGLLLWKMIRGWSSRARGAKKSEADEMHSCVLEMSLAIEIAFNKSSLCKPDHSQNYCAFLQLLVTVLSEGGGCQRVDNWSMYA